MLQVAPAVELMIIDVLAPGAAGESKASSATPTVAFTPGSGAGVIGVYLLMATVLRLGLWAVGLSPRYT